MHGLQDISLANTTLQRLPGALGRTGSVVFAIFLFCFGSVGLSRPVAASADPADPAGLAAIPLSYSFVFIIHGDGEYVYHDPQGNSYRADRKAVAGAIKVALRNPHAEVFIYHQRPRGRAFFIFPIRDGDFRYYRNGILVAEERYWRAEDSSRFDPEVDLFKRYRAAEDPLTTKVFFYYGHEIPEIGGIGYDASSPERSFNVGDLSRALARMTENSRKFDVVILSTCFGGTPHTVAAIAPYTRTIVASPDNLHLSYFDLHQFENLGMISNTVDIYAFAKAFSRQAFVLLSSRVQTAVTLAVYDVVHIQEYLDSVDSIYSHSLSELIGQLPGSIEYYDCNENSAYVLPGMSEGVYVYYRPAHFGRSKNIPYHSGWECCRAFQ